MLLAIGSTTLVHQSDLADPNTDPVIRSLTYGYLLIKIVFNAKFGLWSSPQIGYQGVLAKQVKIHAQINKPIKVRTN
jgi:hypothetical protein